MKKKDITLIVAVVVISAGLSFAVSSLLFGDPEAEPMQVEKTEVLTDSFELPNRDYFNDESINPTQLIRIGEDDESTSPFSTSD